MKSAYSVIIQNSAQRDLHELWDYLANECKEPVIAARMLDKLHEAMASLREMPQRHALLSDELLRMKAVRKIVVDSYIAFYTVNEADKQVAVLRILHARRDWEHILS